MIIAIRAATERSSLRRGCQEQDCTRLAVYRKGSVLKTTRGATSLRTAMLLVCWTNLNSIRRRVSRAVESLSFSFLVDFSHFIHVGYL